MFPNSHDWLAMNLSLLYPVFPANEGQIGDVIALCLSHYSVKIISNVTIY